MIFAGTIMLSIAAGCQTNIPEAPRAEGDPAEGKNTCYIDRTTLNQYQILGDPDEYGNVPITPPQDLITAECSDDSAKIIVRPREGESVANMNCFAFALDHILRSSKIDLELQFWVNDPQGFEGFMHLTHEKTGEYGYEDFKTEALGELYPDDIILIYIRGMEIPAHAMVVSSLDDEGDPLFSHNLAGSYEQHQVLISKAMIDPQTQEPLNAYMTPDAVWVTYRPDAELVAQTINSSTP